MRRTSCAQESNDLVAPTPVFHFTAAPNSEQMRRIHALRADVFCRELGWVGGRGDATEEDAFDDDATHLAVLTPGGDLAASLRLIGEDAPWMLESVFRDLVPPDHVLRRRGAIEASRLAVVRRFRGMQVAGGLRVADLLYRGAHGLCMERGARWVYMVTSVQVLRHMTAAGLPCEPIGPPRRMPDGVLAIAALLDWEAFDPAHLRRWYGPDAPVGRFDPARCAMAPVARVRPPQAAPAPAAACSVS